MFVRAAQGFITEFTENHGGPRSRDLLRSQALARRSTGTTGLPEGVGGLSGSAGRAEFWFDRGI
jgi:hypothetical protein